MAEQMQGIKRRIKSISSTERITNAMKLVSAAKLRRAKQVFEHSRSYLGRIIESIEEAFENGEVVPDEFILGHREIKKTAFVVITSSGGLCGSFNMNVIRKAEEVMASDPGEPELVTVGTKGRDHFRRRRVPILMEHEAPADSLDYQHSKDLADPLIDQFLAGEIDEIVLVYTTYINTLKQEVVAKRIVPIDMQEKVKGDPHMVNVEYEPEPKEVFDYLIRKYVEMSLYNAAIDSATCEHAARRQAMESANDSAAEMLDGLKTSYNRARQAQITDEIIEIVSGSEAQNQ